MGKMTIMSPASNKICIVILSLSVMSAFKSPGEQSAGYFFGGMNLDKIYGVKIGTIEEVSISKIHGRHPLNIRKEPENAAEKESYRERRRELEKDLKEQGQRDPIILTPEWEILDGGRRWEALKKQESRTAMVRFIAPTDDKNVLVQIINASGTLNEFPNFETLAARILEFYGKGRIMQSLAGGKREPGTSAMKLLTIDRDVSEKFKISAAYARRILASIRSKLREGGIIDLSGLELEDRELNYAAKRLLVLEDVIEKREELDRKEKEALSELYQLAPKIKGRGLKLKELMKLTVRSGKVQKSEIKKLRDRFE